MSVETNITLFKFTRVTVQRKNFENPDVKEIYRQFSVS